MTYKKHALVKIGNICNNNCIGCSISSGEIPTKEYDCEELKKEILGLKKANFESIELIGGEVTIEKNFFELLSFCNVHFKEVCLVTNGRMLSYKGFVKKLIKSCPGLNIEIAIHGPDSKTHDAFTGVPGSFQQTVTGLINVLRYRKHFGTVGINTLITQLNKEKIGRILELIKNFPDINEWYLLTFVPVKGRALKNNHRLMPRYSEIKDINNIVREASKILDCVDLNEFPYCMFDADIIKNKKIHFINSDKIECDEQGMISSFNPTFSFNEEDYVSNLSAKKYHKRLKTLHHSFRIKNLKECKNCNYKNECGGVWKDYTSLFGEKIVNDELKQLKNRKKILFITLDVKSQDKNYPLQIAYLISYAKKFPEIRKDYDFDIISKKIKEFNLKEGLSDVLLRNPDTVCFSAYLWNIKLIELLAQQIKEYNKNIKIVIGGPQASLELANKPYFDFIILGEGELPFKELLINNFNKEKLSKKRGICFKLLDKVVYNGTAELRNLDTIPSPFLGNIFDIKKFTKIYFETMRGCPYKCAFCSEKPNVRFFNLNRVERELSYLLKNADKKSSFEIIDNNFNLDRARQFKILSSIKKANTNNLLIGITLNHRLIKKEDIQKFKDANISIIELGLQTTNEQAYQYVNRGGLNLKSFKEKLSFFDEYFTVYIGIIIGLPGDNLQGFKNTIEFIKKLDTKAKIKIHSEILKIIPDTLFSVSANKFKIIHEKEPPYTVKSNYSFSEKDIAKALKLEHAIQKNFNPKGVFNCTPQINKKVHIHSLSDFCAYNSLIATKVLLFLRKNKYQICDNPADSDYILINGCGLFLKERKKNINLLINYLQNSKNKEIIVFGCLMGIEDYINKHFGAIKNVKVIKDNELYKFNNIFNADIKIESINPNIINKNLSREKDNFYIMILSTGCLNKCSYCPYPFYRGGLKSKKISKIVNEFKEGIKRGYKNFFIYSDNIDYFGYDNNENFCDLLEKLFKTQKNFKLSIENFHPKFLVENYEKLKEYFKSDKIRFIDMPIQSGSNRMLSIMKRNYKIEDVTRRIKNLKKLSPNLSISTDIIYCFPGETREDIQKSIAIVKLFDHVTFHKFDKNRISSKIKVAILTEKEIKYRQKMIDSIRKNFKKSKRPFC